MFCALPKYKFFIILFCLCLGAGGLFFLKKFKPKHGRYFSKTPTAFQNGVAVFTASSLDRIFQDGGTLKKPDFGSNASMAMAKNEYRSFQIVLQTKDRPLEDVHLVLDDLMNQQNGKTIHKKHMTWKVVGYVPTQKPYYPTAYVGPWPDPLLPPHPIKIPANRTQPFWVTVYAPAYAEAGDYTGKILVMAKEEKLQAVDLSIHVYDFVLPAVSHLKTAFDFYGHLTKLRFPQKPNEGQDAYDQRIKKIKDQFILTMLLYRMDPILNVDPSNKDDVSDLNRYMAYGLNNFSIGKKGGTFDNNWPGDDVSLSSLQAQYTSYAQILKRRNLFDYNYIYAWDEGDMGNPKAAKIAAMLHKADQGFKNMVCYHGLWDMADGADWIKDIDIWSFQIDDFQEAKMRALQDKGKEIWMYISGPSGTGTPNLAMDFDAMDYRIIPWLCWKYGIKGFLYWCVNWWPLVDPFESAKNSKWEQNGNGLLFYPGDNGPWPSLRVELFREGMEDYEYLNELSRDIKIFQSKGLDKISRNWLEQSRALLAIDKAIASSMSQFTHEAHALESRRKALAAKIEEFNKITQNY